MRRVAVIPARGGSRRIPRKNIRPFLGQPVIAYPIAAARDSGLFDEVIVSTDDAEIAAIAQEAGARVPFARPAELAGDEVSTMPVVRHALAWIESMGCPIDVACCLYPTAVFAGADDLRASWELLDRRAASFVFAAVPYAHPVQRALVDDGNGRCRPMFPEHWNRRTQDLAETLHDAGQFYWLRSPLWSDPAVDPWCDALAYRLPRHRVIDLDEPGDWEHAECLFRLRREASR